MSTQSRSQVIQFKPIDTRNLLLTLIFALQTHPATSLLHSKTGGKSLSHDLSGINAAVTSDNFDAKRVRPLLDAILQLQPNKVVWDAVYNAVTESTPPPRPTLSVQQIPLSINTGNFANLAEHCKYVDGVLKEELGHLHVSIPGFFEAFFGDVPGLGPVAQAVFDKCQEGDSPLYRLASGWQGWPEGAKENDVLSWFAPLTDRLLGLTEGHQAESRPLQGSTANCKLDIGFVDDPNAGLKSNPSANKASKAWLNLGRYAREVLAAQDSRRFVLGFTLYGLRFVSAMLGFLWMNEEQLGFDPTIITVGDKRYIEVERGNGKERIVIDKLIKRVPCVAGQATTCWKAYKEDDPNTPLVIKDSWQYPECEEEGKLLRKATKKEVRNVARYFHHETICVGGQDDDIRANPEKPMPPPSTTGRWALRRDRSSSVSGGKRLSSCAGMPLPPSKRTCSSSPIKRAVANQVHRRVIVRNYGKPIYKASSQISLLAAFEQCIEGYKSLHTRAGMLQRDILLNNLIVNKDDGNPSQRAFLIDLDLAIKEQREQSLGARAKTGTRAFMAIGVLLDDKQHSYMHNLESFFWVLFWICIHCDGPNQERVVPRFDKWNYLDTEELAGSKKGIVDDERDFLKTAQTNFTPYYQPLIPYRWRAPNVQLYHDMKQILQVAQNELKETNRYA
ncbi:hypothetical protein EJ02DRAFT_506533 [Clathrospora elynae]|uniref:Fungal-type protein kinase domain-containing protein n=1 Tax=Clathrospora elynae TaxID=706981 RepID=A0A6A5S8S6_9PLEO|nr:hypothetical protein EJ02DRAFT_506533 [Clathrospora elynae]